MSDEVRVLSGMDIDEISLVDRGANQYATVELSKRDELYKANPAPGDLHAEGMEHDDEDDDEMHDEEQPKGGKLKRVLKSFFDAADEVEEEVEKFGGQNKPPNLQGPPQQQTPFQAQQPAPPGVPAPAPMPAPGGAPPQAAPAPGMAPGMAPPGLNPQMSGAPAPANPVPTQEQGGLAPLPQEVVDYIHELEKQVKELGGGGSPSPDAPDQGQNPFGKSDEEIEEMTDQVVSLDELAKALDDEEQREVIYKALDLVAEAEERAAQAEQIAKAERDARLDREFIEKARSYSNLPVTPEEFGPVLKRLHASFDEDDVAVIEKALGQTNGDLGKYFEEIGKRGSGRDADSAVEAQASEIAKSEGITREQAIAKLYEENPALYDEYTAEKGA